MALLVLYFGPSNLLEPEVGAPHTVLYAVQKNKQ